MKNQLTTDQLRELLEIQKKFDSRIPTPTRGGITYEITNYK